MIPEKIDRAWDSFDRGWMGYAEGFVQEADWMIGAVSYFQHIVQHCPQLLAARVLCAADLGTGYFGQG